MNIIDLLTNWGFSQRSWKGEKGEYWVLGQVLLMLGYIVLPRYSPVFVESKLLFLNRICALGLLGGALFLLVKGLVDLGQSLTPLPYPREEGALVQTGVYRVVRHCLYSGIILGAIAGTIYWLSLSHLIATAVLFVFFDAKATQEEKWLCDRYPEYPAYQKTVKKLLPFVY